MAAMGSVGQSVAAQIAVGVPELGWSCCEALFMPLLLGLHVSTPLLSICWLFSPLLGLFVHPCVGSLSDKHGRRPWILGFGAAAAAGLAATPLCASLLSGNTGAAACAAILAFGLTDVSHDVLVTPTRAAMNDCFNADASERRSAVASGVGKLLGLLCVTFLHASVAWFATALLVAFATCAQFVAPGAAQSSLSTSCSGADQAPARKPSGFWLVWVLQFTGWASICTFQFYFTSAWAEKAGSEPGTPEFHMEVQFASGLLIGNALMFIVSGAVLPVVSRICSGEVNATLAAVLVLAAGLLALAAAPRPYAAAAVVFAIPVGYQVVANTPFAWLERQPGFAEAERGRLTGWLNASLAAAQTVVAVASGPLATVMGGHLATIFYLVAALDGLVVVVAASFVLRERRWQRLQRAQPIRPGAVTESAGGGLLVA